MNLTSLWFGPFNRDDIAWRCKLLGWQGNQLANKRAYF